MPVDSEPIEQSPSDATDAQGEGALPVAPDDDDGGAPVLVLAAAAATVNAPPPLGPVFFVIFTETLASCRRRRKALTCALRMSSGWDSALGSSTLSMGSNLEGLCLLLASPAPGSRCRSGAPSAAEDAVVDEEEEEEEAAEVVVEELSELQMLLLLPVLCVSE
jgi:hypothetical protein